MMTWGQQLEMLNLMAANGAKIGALSEQPEYSPFVDSIITDFNRLGKSRINGQRLNMTDILSYAGHVGGYLEKEQFIDVMQALDNKLIEILSSNK